MVFQACRW